MSPRVVIVAEVRPNDMPVLIDSLSISQVILFVL
jgi:hypothetical protein